MDRHRTEIIEMQKQDRVRTKVLEMKKFADLAISGRHSCRQLLHKL